MSDIAPLKKDLTDEEIRNATPIKFCIKCSKYKMSYDFTIRRGWCDGLEKDCKRCRADYWLTINGKKQWKEKRLTAIGRGLNLFSDAKNRAKAKGWDFDLIKEEIQFTIMLGKCQRTGIAFDLTKNDDAAYNFFAPSLDRVDSSKGYVRDNVLVVCVAYNFGKMQMTERQYVDFCRKVVEFYDNNSAPGPR